MSSRVLLWSCAATVAALVSNTASACGHNHQSWPKGAIVCLHHRQLECMDAGAWHALPGRCEADTPPPSAAVTDPAKAPATEQEKDSSPPKTTTPSPK